MCELLTPQQLSEIPDLYTQENVKDPLCHIKLFTPSSNWTWYIIEVSHIDKDTCFTYVIGQENELGYFLLSELNSIEIPLPIELDTSFTPTLLSEVKRGAK